MEAATATDLTQASEIAVRYITLGSAAKGYVSDLTLEVESTTFLEVGARDLVACGYVIPGCVSQRGVGRPAALRVAGCQIRTQLRHSE